MMQKGFGSHKIGSLPQPSQFTALNPVDNLQSKPWDCTEGNDEGILYLYEMLTEE